MKKVIISEAQYNKIVVERFPQYSKDEVLKKEDESKLDFNVIGVYGTNDMEKFLNDTPYKTARVLGGWGEPHGDPTKNWKMGTKEYPAVIIGIPFSVSKQIQNKETYTYRENELYVVFANDGEYWESKGLWLKHGRPEVLQLLNSNLKNKMASEFVQNLIRLSYFKKYDITDALARLYTILSNVPKTEIADDDDFFIEQRIDQEFREPIRFTLRNGDDPRPIVDKIIEKYGKLSPEIEWLLNQEWELTKRKRPNPYLP